MLIEDFWVMLTAGLVASSCGFIGVYLILRRMAMVGDAISHSVLLGIVLAFLATRILGGVWMFAGAAVAGLFATFLIQLLHRGGAREDAAIGVTFTGLFALGVVLLSLYAGDVHLDTEHVLFGELAYVPYDVLIWQGVELGPRAVWTVGAAFGLTLLVTGLLFKEFKVCAFDPAFALSLGIPVTLLHYVQMTLVSVTTVAAFERRSRPGGGDADRTGRHRVPADRPLRLDARLSVVTGVVSAWTGYAVAVWLDVSISGAMATAAGAVLAWPSCSLRGMACCPQRCVAAGSPRRHRSGCVKRKEGPRLQPLSVTGIAL